MPAGRLLVLQIVRRFGDFRGEPLKLDRTTITTITGIGTTKTSVAPDAKEIVDALASGTTPKVFIPEPGFTRLFNGGTASLRIAESDDDRDEAGIDILARPPGKRVSSLAQLSGGERALTAVALLLAILRVRPAPFCVLDEVDAALDERNVGRFTQALRELTDRTQFVVITHNRGTIEAADMLYGVSMDDGGVSKVISLKLSELDEQRERAG